MRAFWKYLHDPVKFVCLLSSLLPVYLVALFMQSYGRRVPIYDQWERTLLLVVHVKNGTLTASDIFALHNGHRIVFSNLVTAGLASLTTWNPKQEMWLNLILGVINFGLLLALVWRQHRPQFHLLIVPIAALHFTLVQDFNWTVAFQACWHFVTLFFLLALNLIVRSTPGWRPFLGAAFLLTCASFSGGNGMVGWLVLPLVMWVYGYRRWYYLPIWLVFFMVVFKLYFAGGTSAAITVINPLLMGRYVLHFLGAPLAALHLRIALIMGSLGLLIFGANLLYLYRRMSQQHLVPWVALVVNAIGSAMTIALARLDGTDAQLWRAVVTRFMGVSSLFWVAVSILTGLVIYRLIQQPERSRPEQTLLYSNLVVGVLVALFHIQSSAWILQHDMRFYRYGMLDITTYDLRNEESCVLDYPLYRESDCIYLHPIRSGGTEPVYLLAAYQQAIFAEEESTNVLPETYLAGSPLILHTPSQWLNLYLHQYLLDTLPQSDLIYIAPVETFEPVENFPDPPQHLFADMGAEALPQIEAMIADHEQVWYIHTPETNAASTVFFERMAANGYIATPYPIQHERFRLAKFSIWRFQQPPQETQTFFSFGEENISLQAWSIHTDTVQPCENIRLQSWWQSAAVPHFNYSATLVLVAPDGTFIAQKDAAIGDTLMQLWFADELYFDERILTVPCDAAPGAYTLTFGMYLNTGSGFEDLPAYDPAGESLGTRATITTVTVQ